MRHAVAQPRLQRPADRFQVSGTGMTRARLTSLLNRCRPAKLDIQVSLFSPNYATRIKLMC